MHKIDHNHATARVVVCIVTASWYPLAFITADPPKDDGQATGRAASIVGADAGWRKVLCQALTCIAKQDNPALRAGLYSPVKDRGKVGINGWI